MRKLLKVSLAICLFSCISNAQAPRSAKDISPLLIGESLPKADLKDAEGNIISLKSIVKEKPTVLVFYRGGWCPYCNAQLSGLVEIEKNILKLGYQIIAISPDDYGNIKATEEKDNINYKVFSDPNGMLIQEVGIAFQTPTAVKGFLLMKSREGETSQVIPAPTVMILDQKGTIKFEYINPNYKERISEKMLLAVLKTLKD